MSIIEGALKLLKTRVFVQIATANRHCRPNCAPKFLLKISGRQVYLVDYSIGTTFENLKENPEISLSFIDTDSLLGYRLNGKAEIIQSGPLYQECLNELHKREIDLTVERVVKSVHDGKKYGEFELGVKEKFLVYKITLEDGSEITPHGEIKRENT